MLRQAWMWGGVAAVVVVLGQALTACTQCDSGQVREGNRCVRPCNRSEECGLGLECVDGRCAETTATSSSSGGAGSTSAATGTSTPSPSSSSAGVSSSVAGSSSSSETPSSSSSGVDSSSAAPSSSTAPDAGPDMLEYVHDTQLEFSVGDFTGTTQFNNGVTPSTGNTTAEYRSAWLAAPSGVTNGALAWVPNGPYGKPLPAVQNRAEANLYPDGVDMTGAVFLLPLEGNVGSGVADNAGLPSLLNNHPVRMVDLDSPSDSAYVAGPFGTGLHLQRSDYLVLDDADTHPDFSYGAGGFTWALWVRFVDCGLSQDNAVAMGGEVPHVWLGANCPSGEASFQVDASHNLTGPNIMDSTWHHLAGTLQTSNPERATLFLDGAVVDTLLFSPGDYANFTKKIFLGNFPIGTAPVFDYGTDVDVDEVVMFKRALTATEVGNLAARGQRRVRVQVRACDGDAAACTSRAFVGPGGLMDAFFADEGNTLAELPPPVAIPTAGLGPLVQYRLLFTNNAPAGAPGVSAVTVRLAR